MVTLARKHHMPWPIAVRIIFLFRFVASLYWLRLNLTYWVSQTAWVSFATVFGFPVLMRLRHLIKQARIESIMKGH